MRTTRWARTVTAAGLLTMLLGAMLVIAPGVGATPPEGHKVTICHRTNAVTNPYVAISVDYDAANGTIVQGPDHYVHLGPVFDFGAADAPGYETTYPKPRSGDQWGDIIPPVDLDGGGRTTGLNWTPQGQAILEAGCQLPDESTGPVVIVDKRVPNVDVDEQFDFSITGHPAFTLGDDDSEEFTVEPGTVTVEEELTTLEGYAFSGASCRLVSSEHPDGVDLGVVPDGGAVTFAVDDGDIVTCTFTNVPITTPTHAATIVKTNDANRTGGFSDDETAPAQGADVAFRLVITNTGTGPLTVESLTDDWPGGTTPDIDLLALEGLECTTGVGETLADLPMAVGTVIPAGAVVTCSFTVDDYAPGPGQSRTNTVVLGAAQTADVSDTSIVRTPGGSTPPVVPTPSYSVEIVKSNDADGDGVFHDTEFATSEGDDVTFRVTIANTGDPVTLSSLVDVFDDTTLDLLGVTVDLECTRSGTDVTLAAGSVLPAASTTTCTFTLAGYAPAAGGTAVDTVTVDTNETAPEADDSTVLVGEVLPTPTYGVEVVKDNDANGDGTFGDDESAVAGGRDVTFRITIRNTGSGPLELVSLVDEFGGTSVDLLADATLECGAVDLSVGTVLPAGSETVCTFVLRGYSPDAGGVLENTVTVVTDEAVAHDASTVRSPEVQGRSVVRPAQLPRTGGDGGPMVVAGLALVLIGAVLVAGSRRGTQRQR